MRFTDADRRIAILEEIAEDYAEPNLFTMGGHE